MISVVLPVYNGEKYLEEAIMSILGQTYKDIELIIVNDCSTDNSFEIISRYALKDKRIKIVNNDSNQKLPKSLNIGFELSRGEYLTWTSDDNIMHPNALEVLLKNLQEKDADLVFSRCETIDSNGQRIGKTEDYKDLDELYYNNIVLASFLYKRKVHETLNGYDTTKFLIEDYDFWLRAYRQFKFVFVSEILYKIRFHNSNLGIKHLEDVKLRKIELLKENLKYVDEKRITNRIYKEISNCYYEASNFYYNKVDLRNKKRILIYRLKDFIQKLVTR